MTNKEIDKLATLTVKILDITEILSEGAAKTLYSVVTNAEDKEVLDILIKHVDILKLYEIYNRFDREASRRYINSLQSTIQELSSED